LEPAEGDDPSAPARPWRYRDGRGRVGFVGSVSNPICGSCDRIRLTADGQVRTCLFALKEWDFRALLREGATDGQVEQLLRDAVLRKQPGHLIGQAEFRQPDRGMSAIGG
ncbi:MAG: GTP 3',8-cyclase MoaA, partial [Candidatus Eisenbacteria bacterium]|nr:GTP 3',8-cyclase MoaA [Candidatus Eisenbacteria bacterium]